MRLIDEISQVRLKNYYALEKLNKILSHEDYKKSKIDNKNLFCGRLLLKRDFGALTFFTINFNNKEIQLVSHKDSTNNYINMPLLDRGDNIFFSVKGAITNKNNEQVPLIIEWKLISKCFFDLPQKHFGLKDIDIKYKMKYVDLMVNKSEFEFYQKLTKLYSSLDIFLQKKNFLKIITPVLEREYGGANALPFETKLQYDKKNLFLSVAPEFHLKKYLVSGFLNIYSISSCFRNEGIDTTHHPEFLSLEIYKTFADCNDMSKIAQQVIKYIFKFLDNDFVFKRTFIKLKYEDAVNKFFLKNHNLTWKKSTYKDLIKILILKNDLERFKTKYKESNKKNDFLLMFLFENYVEEFLIQPIHITDFPAISSSLAEEKKNKRLDRIETYMFGKEIANMFTEEINFLKLETNMFNYRANEDESEPYNSSFLRAMAYGMNRAGGIGLGLQRIILMASKKLSIKDLIFQPLSNID